MGRAEDIQAEYREREKAAAAANGKVKPKRAKPAPSATEDGWELPGDHPPYLATAVVDGLTELADMAAGGRNGQLFVAAKTLGQFEDVDRDWLRDKLYEACEKNGLTADDGLAQTTGSIRSGFAAADTEVADHGWRDPDGLDEPIVTVVDMAAFGIGSASAAAAATTTASQSNTATVTPIVAPRTGTSSPLGPVMAKIVAAEGDFWDTAALQRIYDAGIAQMVPPWALLAHCCGRALAMIPVNIRLPGVIGGARGGSINWYAAVVADSGQGKSIAADLAEELVPGFINPVTHLVEPIERNVGSGEGIIHAFVRKQAKGGANPVPPVFHSAILFSAEEIDSLTANAVRQGSTVLPVLRMGFTGSTLGFAYAKSTNNYHLEKHSYRMVFMLSGQPSRYDALLSDQRGGTPQRFQWFPAFDLRIHDVDPTTLPTIAQLARPAPSDWTQIVLDIPEAAREMIRATRVKGAHGITDGMSSHEVFVREKFAVGLGALHGRTAPNEDDWRRAGIAMNVSRIVREWVQEQLAGAEEEDDTKAGKRRAVQFDATDVEREQRKINRIADSIRGKLADGPKKESALINLHRHNRPLARQVLDVLVDEGQVDRRANAAGVVWVALSKLV